MLIGAGSGYLFFTMTPPVFESQAVFSFLIDQSKTGALTDLEQDGSIVAAGDVFYSSDVAQQVVDAAQKQGVDFNINNFRQNAFIERTNSEWTLRLRSNNPEASTRLVNLWADISNDQLKIGMRHAGLSGIYQHQLESLVRCVEQVPGWSRPHPPADFPLF